MYAEKALGEFVRLRLQDFRNKAAGDVSWIFNGVGRAHPPSADDDTLVAPGQHLKIRFRGRVGRVLYAPPLEQVVAQQLNLRIDACAHRGRKSGELLEFAAVAAKKIVAGQLSINALRGPVGIGAHKGGQGGCPPPAQASSAGLGVLTALTADEAEAVLVAEAVLACASLMFIKRGAM